MSRLYSIALEALLQLKKHINIVVIGANDGKVNDPIYDFSIKNSNKTRICLIEPNTALLPYLQENYASHPCHKIANCAVGQDGGLTLYAIKEAFWEAFQPAYADGWPLYRAATGITSANREHLEQALLSHTTLNPDEVITALNVPSKALDRILLELNWPIPIDVLQIDTEGYDDSVIYASSLQATRPTVIYFESCHIPADRIQLLSTHLSSHNYQLHHVDGNTLAVERQTNLFISSAIEF